MLGTGFGIIDEPSGSTVGDVYYSILDVSAAVVILALIFVDIKRYIAKPERLADSTRTAGIILPVLLAQEVDKFIQSLPDVKLKWKLDGEQYDQEIIEEEEDRQYWDKLVAELGREIRIELVH